MYIGFCVKYPLFLSDFNKIWICPTVFFLFRVFLQLLPEIFFILRIERDMTKMYTGFCVKYPLFLSDFNEIWICPTAFFFEKYSNISIHENLCSGSRGVPCGLTDE